MKNVNEPVNDFLEQTNQETIVAVKDTTQAIELREEGTNKAINEVENLIKYSTSFDLRPIEPLGEVANSKNTSQFRFRHDPISRKTLYK